MTACSDTSVFAKLEQQESSCALLYVLEDFDGEKRRLDEAQAATLNILEDLDQEKDQFKETRAATFNILEDFHRDRLHLEEIQKALMNILDDLNESTAELRKAHDVLETRVRERTSELARSNAELEQFAYVASHDLQEPLRMVSSYVQLLQRRYEGKLDADADDFIGFAVEGALRMQKLLNGLLAYSRVGTRGEPFRELSLESVFSEVLENLQLRIKETNAEVTHDSLPLVFGDASQLTQLFQNLIENALKFHGPAIPRVHVSAEIDRDLCIFRVKDNGIGIATGYQKKVFEIFQRLHTRKEYPGAGIGLAICKRIADRHGGKIWVESQPGEGSTFYFAMPAGQRSHSDG